MRSPRARACASPSQGPGARRRPARSRCRRWARRGGGGGGEGGGAKLVGGWRFLWRYSRAMCGRYDTSHLTWKEIHAQLSGFGTVRGDGSNMLAPNPDVRPTTEQLVARLEDGA